MVSTTKFHLINWKLSEEANIKPSNTDTNVDMANSCKNDCKKDCTLSEWKQNWKKNEIALALGVDKSFCQEWNPWGENIQWDFPSIW